MKTQEEIANALEMFSSSMRMERTLRFKTVDGTAVCLQLSLSASDHISDKDWENAQFKFQDLQTDAVSIFQEETQ